MKRAIIGFAIAGTLLIAMAYYVTQRFAPQDASVAATALQSLREQNKLSAFAARFVTVVTSTRSTTIGLSAQKTLIVPANVRYEVDLAKLQQSDVQWDAGAKTLSVRLPQPAPAETAFALGETREYSSGMVLMALTDAEGALDKANRAAAQKDILAQANAPVMLQLARDATARAVERSFAMPLKATGVNAQVKVEFTQ